MSKIDLQNYQAAFSFLETHKLQMQEMLIDYANINTGTYHLQGLEKFSRRLKQDFQILNPEEAKEYKLPPQRYLDNDYQVANRPLGKALSFRKRPKAPTQILLNAHLDTVFGADSPFQKCQKITPHILNGPGVADIKGGIIIILWALQAFEKTPFSKKLGWEAFFNPDEEIGSPGSYELFCEKAPFFDRAFIVEPTTESGALVKKRKGSCNMTLLVEGKATHAGRYFHEGISAISVLAQFISHSLTLSLPKSTTLNFGVIRGGSARNIVPQFAECQINIRAVSAPQLHSAIQNLHDIATQLQQQTQAKITLHEDCIRAPKEMDEGQKKLMELIESCYHSLELPLSWEESGGVCDGNLLLEKGLHNIDTLGVKGGKIHTHDEFCDLDSLVEKAKVLVMLLGQSCQK